MNRGSVLLILKVYDEWHEAFVLENVHGQDLGRVNRVTEQWQDKRRKLIEHLIRTPPPSGKAGHEDTTTS